MCAILVWTARLPLPRQRTNSRASTQYLVGKKAPVMQLAGAFLYCQCPANGLPPTKP